VGRCPRGCASGQQVAPLDTALGLTPYQTTGVEVQQLACALAVFVPFETAAALLRRLLTVPVSPGAVWGWVQSVGQRAMARLEQELTQLAAGQPPAVEAPDPTTAAHPLLMGADGVMVAFRPTEGTAKGRIVWREIKVAILARLGRRTTAAGQVVTPLERRRLVAVLGDIDALSPRLWLEALRPGVQAAPLVAWLSDGGRGFWRVFRERLAGRALGILDFYHAAQHLWTGAAAWFADRTQQAHAWFATAHHRLRHGETNAVLSELTETLALADLPASARTTLQNLYDYLDKHRAHIDYEKFKELGLPLGSGMVESACKSKAPANG